jgi:hypothetical protein
MRKEEEKYAIAAELQHNECAVHSLLYLEECCTKFDDQ